MPLASLSTASLTAMLAADSKVVEFVLGELGMCFDTRPMVVKMVLKNLNRIHSASLNGNFRIRLHTTQLMQRQRNPRAM